MKHRNAIFWICILAANVVTFGLLLHDFITNYSVGQFIIAFNDYGEGMFEIIFMAITFAANIYLFVQIIRCRVAIVNET